MVPRVDGIGDLVTCITTVSNDFWVVRRLLGAHTAGLWRAVFVWRFKAAFGPGRAGPRNQKRIIDLWSQRWCEMVPDTHPPRSHGPMCEKWTQRTNIDTKSLIYQQVNLWWSILTWTVNPPTGKYGWYWPRSFKYRDTFVFDSIDDTCVTLPISKFWECRRRGGMTLVCAKRMRLHSADFWRILWPNEICTNFLNFVTIHVDCRCSVIVKHSFVWKLSNIQEFEYVWPLISDFFNFRSLSSRLCGFFLTTCDEGVWWQKARVLGLCNRAARIYHRGSAFYIHTVLEAENPGCAAHVKRTTSRRTSCWK